MNTNSLKEALHYFFTRTLPKHRGVAKNTLATYQQTFKQFIPHLQAQLGDKPLSQIQISDLTPEHILSFLDHLEADRHVTPATRNLRLASLRSFARCLVFISPNNLALADQILRLPRKRHPQPFVHCLEPDELAPNAFGVSRSTPHPLWDSATPSCCASCTTPGAGSAKSSPSKFINYASSPPRT